MSGVFLVVRKPQCLCVKGSRQYILSRSARSVVFLSHRVLQSCLDVLVNFSHSHRTSEQLKSTEPLNSPYLESGWRTPEYKPRFPPTPLTFRAAAKWLWELSESRGQGGASFSLLPDMFKSCHVQSLDTLAPGTRAMPYSSSATQKVPVQQTHAS